jgi:hypothetical protein
MQHATQSRWRRVVREVGLWWLVGAVIVALLCSFRDIVDDNKLPYTRQIDLSRDVAWVNRYLPAAALDAVSEGRDDTGWRMDGRQQLAARFGEEAATLEVWRVLPDGTIERGNAPTSIMAWRVRRGWPFLCVEGAAWVPGVNHAPIPDRMFILSESGGRVAVVIPFGVRIFPFALNAALFGVAIAGVARLPGAVERMLRRRRGTCARCAYPLRGALTCPECGLAAKVKP